MTKKYNNLKRKTGDNNTGDLRRFKIDLVNTQEETTITPGQLKETRAGLVASIADIDAVIDAMK